MQQNHLILKWKVRNNALLSFSLFVLSNCEYFPVSRAALNYTYYHSLSLFLTALLKLKRFYKLNQTTSHLQKRNGCCRYSPRVEETGEHDMSAGMM